MRTGGGLHQPALVLRLELAPAPRINARAEVTWPEYEKGIGTKPTIIGSQPFWWRAVSLPVQGSQHRRTINLDRAQCCSGAVSEL